MMVRTYRGSEVPRPFNPATIKRMIEGPDAGAARGRVGRMSDADIASSKTTVATCPRVAL